MPAQWFALATMSLTLLAPVVRGAEKPVEGAWQGKLELGAVELRIVFHFAPAPDGTLTATMDSPDQGAKGIAIDAVTRQGDDIKVGSPQDRRGTRRAARPRRPANQGAVEARRAVLPADLGAAGERARLSSPAGARQAVSVSRRGSHLYEWHRQREAGRHADAAAGGSARACGHSADRLRCPGPRRDHTGAQAVSGFGRLR